ncbi:MAG: response regulator [Holophaga sp.]|nr:response regulator [Holophaga sp.]
MPRLLLVDDNPSIHKIAETLLATSDVQLISCDSGAQAMALVNQGDQFDVALVDTSMLGMDGWALLKQLRETDSTARMPVAMMAGVLDMVDPEKLRLAPIQGFLKKPVELRDLGDRVKRLMEMPVAPPPPPPVPVPPPEAAITATLPTQPDLLGADDLKGADLQGAEDDSDLLLLGPDDLLPEAPEEEAQAPEAEPEPLDLEGLDLEGLQNLTFPTSAMPAAEALEAGAAEAPAPEGNPALAVPEFLLADTLPDLPVESTQAFADQLPDLGPAMDHPIGQAETASEGSGSLLELGEPIDWSDDSDAMVGIALGGPEPPAAPEAPAAAPEVITLSDILDPPTASQAATSLSSLLEAPMAPMTTPEVPSPEPPPAEAVPDPLATLLADPVLMDRLAKALVARLGDQVLREVAWEVMPDLAERLQSKEAR